MARFNSLDPLASDYPSLSGYSYVSNNPVIFIDPDGRKVKYANFRCRIATFFGKFGNKAFRKGFKEFIKDKINIFQVHFGGVIDTKETGDTDSFVKNGNQENTLEIHWTISKNLKDKLDESSKYVGLHEEFCHIDDALGGIVFGGTNKDTFVWSEDGYLDQKHLAFGEVNAWIWRADNAKKLPVVYLNDLTNPGNKSPVRQTLMQQIKETCSLGLSNRKRRLAVRNLLYRKFSIKLESSSFKGQIINPSKKEIRIDEPYK